MHPRGCYCEMCGGIPPAAAPRAQERGAEAGPGAVVAPPVAPGDRVTLTSRPGGLEDKGRRAR